MQNTNADCLNPPPHTLSRLQSSKITGLKKVKLVDASWIWTEPHSRRLKLKLTVQKEVGNGAVLQQAMAVTFVERNQQCEGCAAAFTDNTWTAVVQVRQRVDHKRTFFYLEQLILKHSAHSQCTNIQVSVVSSKGRSLCNPTGELTPRATHAESHGWGVKQKQEGTMLNAVPL